MNSKTNVFREEPGFLKLFELFKEKYRSLGRISGNVSLNAFSSEEIQSIAGFLGQSYDKLMQKGSLSLVQFEKELPHTGFSDYTLLKLLEEVLEESILTKQEEAQRAEKQEDEFIHSLKKVSSQGDWWLDWIHTKQSDSRWIWSYYKQNKEELFEKVVIMLKAFNLLPKEGEFERLPFFSQKVTGNPHDFDPQEVLGKLLLHCLYVDQVLHGNDEVTMPRSTEELNDVLAKYGIMRDDLWNFVTCQGLLASSNGVFHPVWQAAVTTNTVMNVPMKELTKLNKAWAAIGTKVWIIENSSVCSGVMDAVPSAPIICTHGQLRMASWRLLDLLVQSNCTLYYSGDCDPEGLVIADRLKKRYRNRVILWRMDRENYEKSLSHEEVSTRLSKLDSISSPELTELVNVMRNIKMAGYQEALVSDLIHDIEEHI